MRSACGPGNVTWRNRWIFHSSARARHTAGSRISDIFATLFPREPAFLTFSRPPDPTAARTSGRPDRNAGAGRNRTGPVPTRHIPSRPGHGARPGTPRQSHGRQVHLPCPEGSPNNATRCAKAWLNVRTSPGTPDFPGGRRRAPAGGRHDRNGKLPRPGRTGRRRRGIRARRRPGRQIFRKKRSAHKFPGFSARLA